MEDILVHVFRSSYYIATLRRAHDKVSRDIFVYSKLIAGTVQVDMVDSEKKSLNYPLFFTIYVILRDSHPCLCPYLMCTSKRTESE